ncbi:conserved hypothetical protein [Neospora caninum Liverpool]|uniref:Toxoplasma gondii family A protein n=1 Tax=Neospora caninum (strain Liverpool) TaxID=572307 RepID=F0VJZ9_NEOCL|nr:conserved hypothetical protein [Neospora caninum Liverpool]CBZ53229.1 conserved hypothetical protein [Neospora caninum Liverpool]CEL67219.1 TPA: hypothetical protein BN1204_030160 [Neospora caninum Liverpool]|eukprot:XP_003883261.1 conserved hypothetical protein [Neospora caninum Liverpool]
MAFPRVAPLSKVAFFCFVVVDVLLGNLTCDASSPYQGTTRSGSAVNAQFTISIPQVGIAEDERHEVFLGGSKVLQIIDKTKNAVPYPDSFAKEAFTYTADGKTCDVTRKVPYSTLFPGVPAGYTYWSSELARARTVLDSTYTYTSPSADQLENSASFCIIFKVPEGSGTSVRTLTGLASFNKQLQSRKMNALDTEGKGRSGVSSLLRTGSPSIGSQRNLQPIGPNSKTLATESETEESLRTITVIVHSGATAGAGLRGTMLAVLGAAWLFH